MTQESEQVHIPSDSEIQTMQTAVSEATTALATAEHDTAVAVKRGEVAAIRTAFANEDTQRSALDKATKALAHANDLRKFAGRMAAAEAAKKTVSGLLSDATVLEAFAQGCTGIHITADSEGHLSVNVSTGISAMPKTRSPRTPNSTSSESTGTRVRSKVRNIATGELYGTREWLEQFGNEKEQEAAIAAKTKVTSASGASYYPNFQPYLKSAIGRMGDKWELVAAS